MNDTTFFWHDYETFGLSPAKDWPAQFAGVRTDLDLNEVGEPQMFYCQPPVDRLPEPGSCLVTGITPQHCFEQGLPEHAFAQRVLAALGQPGTIGVGYNTLRFDDEFTRYLLWRNLRDPYEREWANGCSRWDLIDVVRCTYALRPEGIHWPQDGGRPSFRLEHLTAANGLAHSNAHDALSDVRATIALARLIKAKQPRLFQYTLGLRSKHEAAKQVQVGQPFLHISRQYGVERGFMAVVMSVGQHPVNRNEVLVWDLAEDPRQLLDLSAAEVRRRLFTRADALPPGETRLPIKSIHLNRSPIVISQLRTLTPERAAHWGIDFAVCEQHAQVLAPRVPALAGLWSEVMQAPARPEAPDVDQDLYGGFVDRDDRARLQRLLALSPEELALDRTGFNDERLSELVFRYRARNFPQTLTAAERERWRSHCSDRLHHGLAGCLTIDAFQVQIDALSETQDEAGQELLGELYDWADAITPPLSPTARD